MTDDGDSRWARAEAPPTIANIGPGFDALGLAVPMAGDVVWVRRRSQPGITLTLRGGVGDLPRDPGRNSASVAAGALLELCGEPGGLELILEKRLPTGGSGLGSSGASCAAAVAATAALLADVSDEDLLEAASRGEEIACGSPHVDNVAPALFGGIVLIGEDGEVLPLPSPAGVELAIARPHVDIPTAAARAVLPKTVARQVAVAQARALATLVHALHTDDVDLLGAALLDRIAAPARAHLLPHYEDVLDAAEAAGALGASMSGSGPAVFALCHPGDAAEVAEAMAAVWASEGLPSEVVHAGSLSGRGALASVRLDAPPTPG